MKICYICPTRTPHIKAYIDYFASKGHDIHIVSLTKDPIDKTTIHYVGVGNKLNALRYFFCCRRVASALKKINPDICHAHWVTSNGFMATLAGAKPLIVTAHGTAMRMLNNPLRRAIVNFVVRHSDLVNPVSYELANLMNIAGVPMGKMFVASVGVDANMFALMPREFNARPIKLINTRAFRKIDNIDVLVRALEILLQKKVNFICTFAGPKGPEFEKVKNLASKLEVDKYCNFLEGYNHSDLPKLLSEHQIYITCNSADGTSISLLEAMASGLVALASDIPANRPWVKDGKNGMLTVCGNSNDLAIAIEKLYKNPSMCQAFAKNSINTIVTTAARNIVFEKLEGHYLRLVKRKQ